MEPTEIDSLRQQIDNKGWRLHFPPALEAEFQRDFAQRYRIHMQLGILMGVLALLVGGVTDPFWQPAEAAEMWTVRLMAVVPMLGLLLLSRGPMGDRHMQVLTAVASCLAVAGLVGLSLTANERFSHYYSSSITLVMLVIFVLSRLQFSWGVGSALTMMALLNTGLFGFSNADLRFIIIDNFLFLSAAVFALVGTFLIERNLRQSYLQARLLAFENSGLEESNQRLQHLSAIDELTQIANRRSLEMALSTEWQRALRKREVLSIAMIDVDHFKLFNDTYGHPAGDECLRSVADVLKNLGRRPGDLAARYGGEEFVLVLPGATEAQARMMVECARERILALAIPHRRSGHGVVTASFGIASFVPDPHHGGPAALLLAADQALYRAKEGGRNCVEINTAAPGSVT
ncbi:MAG: diguanylate cyclase [Moraxellaceae bacterium]|jgi:diguanylate cyclase (GGDEF)-like protein|nr:diguanylate cyclase [Moraxellaceae bacterium]